jgi:hypothetical protein
VTSVTKPAWRCDPLGLRGDTHVHPVNDLREHVVDPIKECWCSPTVTEEGIIVHNALDRREQYETGDLKPH